jgi:hypothetical protein
MAIRSRYGSHALALGARPRCAITPESVGIAALVAGFGGLESVDTTSSEMAACAVRSVDISGGEIAGFGFDSLGRPRRRTGIPAAFR